MNWWFVFAKSFCQYDDEFAFVKMNEFMNSEWKRSQKLLDLIVLRKNEITWTNRQVFMKISKIVTDPVVNFTLRGHFWITSCKSNDIFNPSLSELPQNIQPPPPWRNLPLKGAFTYDVQHIGGYLEPCNIYSTNHPLSSFRETQTTSSLSDLGALSLLLVWGCHKFRISMPFISEWPQS